MDHARSATPCVVPSCALIHCPIGVPVHIDVTTPETVVIEPVAPVASVDHNVVKASVLVPVVVGDLRSLAKRHGLAKCNGSRSKDEGH